MILGHGAPCFPDNVGDLILLRVKRFGALPLTAVVIAALLSAPIVLIVSFVFFGTSDVWQHLWHTVLPIYLRNSALLMLGVAAGTLLIGVATAWLTACYDFPARRLCALLLLLPMAMPAYIVAYTYTGLLDYAGPVQSWLRAQTGLGYGQYWFPSIHSLGGAVAILTLVLYPYVYLLARAAFIAQSGQLLEVARTLGRPLGKSFFTVVLPIARPAIAVGVSLALMETLADYGTVQYFGVPTFTTGIFRTFYGFGDAVAAAQLATVLLAFVSLIVVLERFSRRGRRYFLLQDQHLQRPRRLSLSRPAGYLALCCCAIPPFLGFILPLLVLLRWGMHSAEWFSAGFLSTAAHSFLLAGLATLIVVAIALLLAYAVRLSQSPVARIALQLTSLGYALPGTIIAIGVVIGFAWLDHNLVVIVEQALSMQLGLLFSGTLVALLFAYTVRFLAVSSGAVQSGLQTLKPSLDGTAQLLGRRPWQLMREVHVPLLRPAVLTALLIVFVDVLKELPATLMLRPFDFNTLAIRAFEMASDERLMDAAPASIMIVAVGLLPVMLLNHSIVKD